MVGHCYFFPYLCGAFTPQYMENDTFYLNRCFELARLGAGRVSPNPLVGALLADADGIIAEGWHQYYGGAHAEVNCLNAVRPQDRYRISKSTLYCSLEPCFHYGKTPPCVEAVLRAAIPKVVISNLDPNPLTAGQSVKKLRAAGVEVTEAVLEKEGAFLNRAFFTWILQKRPYVILKWAQSRDGFVGRPHERTAISSAPALRYVHRLRGETDAILVGGQTALTDNPRLDTRFYPGARNPLRVAADRRGQLPATHHLLDDSAETWILGLDRAGSFERTRFYDASTSAPGSLAAQLYAANKGILLVEGGPKTHLQWLESGLWDEIIVLENNKMLRNGIFAPVLPEQACLSESFWIQTDHIRRYCKLND